MVKLPAVIAFAVLISGCVKTNSAGVLFCDVERPRTFTADEAAWRIENAEANLRLDLATNETGEAYCGWSPAQKRKR